MHLLEVSNPVAQQRGMLNILKPVKRPESLDGKIVGLIWSCLLYTSPSPRD